MKSCGQTSQAGAANAAHPWGMRPICVAPDWICEILSPSDERRDRVRAQGRALRAVGRWLLLVGGTRRASDRALKLREAFGCGSALGRTRHACCRA
jgi:hypothetical protein